MAKRKPPCHNLRKRIDALETTDSNILPRLVKVEAQQSATLKGHAETGGHPVPVSPDLAALTVEYKTELEEAKARLAAEREARQKAVAKMDSAFDRLIGTEEERDAALAKLRDAEARALCPQCGKNPGGVCSDCGVIDCQECNVALADDRVALHARAEQAEAKLRKVALLVATFQGKPAEHPWSDAECDALTEICEALDLYSADAKPKPSPVEPETTGTLEDRCHIDLPGKRPAKSYKAAVEPEARRPVQGDRVCTNFGNGRVTRVYDQDGATCVDVALYDGRTLQCGADEVAVAPPATPARTEAPGPTVAEQVKFYEGNLGPMWDAGHRAGISDALAAIRKVCNHEASPSVEGSYCAGVQHAREAVERLTAARDARKRDGEGAGEGAREQTKGGKNV